MGRQEMQREFRLRNVLEKSHLEDREIDGRMALRYDIQRQRSSMHPFIVCLLSIKKNRGSSVGIALGYGLDIRGYRDRFPAGAGNFSLHHRVQNVSGAHPASYSMGTGGSFPGGKAAGA
jgi:hypothetical protein